MTTKSYKLNNNIRDNIVRRAIYAPQNIWREGIKHQEHALALKAYHSVFDKEIIKAVNALPELWKRIDSCLRFNANGWSVNLNLITDDNYKGVPVPQFRFCTPLGNLKEPLAKEVQDFSQMKDKADEDFWRKKEKFQAFIAQFTTTKQLKELWPEGKVYYEDLIDQDDTPKLPAIIKDDINTMLGLA